MQDAVMNNMLPSVQSKIYTICGSSDKELFGSITSDLFFKALLLLPSKPKQCSPADHCVTPACLSLLSVTWNKSEAV